MDDELLAVEALLISTRTRRNSLALVSRLFPEILAHIFHLLCLYSRDARRDRRQICADDWKTIEALRRSPPHIKLGWITVTYVCTRWREVALSYSHLWVDIDYELGENWVRQMLLRAKSSPLFVQSGMGSNNISTLRPTLHERFSNIRSLVLRLYKAELLECVPVIDLGNGRLSELVLHCGMNIEQSRLSAPPRLVSDNPLRSVDLREINFPWTVPSLFSGLEDLSVVFSRTSRAHNDPERPTFVQLLTLLSNLHQLRTLILKGCLPRPEQNALTPHTTLKLTWLQQLSISGTLRECEKFLDVLDIPSTSKLAVSVFHPDPNDDRPAVDELSTLISFTATFIRRSSFPRPIQAIDISADREAFGRDHIQEFIIKGWRDVDEHSALITKSIHQTPPSFELELPFESDRDLLALFENATNTLPLHDLRLFCADHLGFLRQAWLVVLGSLTTIEVVEIMDGDLDALTHALLLPEGEGPFT
jgi:hypothetical protein